ncbi:hypothetical protein NHX12_017059 [Muraenolepis orangiensis]|uniref:Death domain-containing protein n=1 Tax=Muraenolepis orangiensis TaxID=630683 RepID=A0A9Q0DBE9_9TELE|nr:hypothetical protein NHX12_017059 [Muraenolepis orangiensis]
MGGQERICLKDIGVQVRSATKPYMKIDKPPVWDCEHKMAVKPRRTTGDGNKKTKDLSDKQLLQVAESLGHEWEKAAIYLKLSLTDLDNIKAESPMNVSMQKMRMLVQWRKQRPPGEATAQHLLEDLKDLKDLSCDAQQLLKGNILHTHARTHTHTHLLLTPHLFITSYRPCVQLAFAVK